MKAPQTKPRIRENLRAYHRTIQLQRLILAAFTITAAAALIGLLTR